MSIVTCDTCNVVFEGGHVFTAYTPSKPTIIITQGSLPLSFSSNIGLDDSAYHVEVSATTITTFQAYAYCFDNPPMMP